MQEAIFKVNKVKKVSKICQYIFHDVYSYIIYVYILCIYNFIIYILETFFTVFTLKMASCLRKPNIAS